MQAESSLLYPKHESRNNGLRSPEETQRTIDLLLAEVAKLQEQLHIVCQHQLRAAKYAVQLKEELDKVRAGNAHLSMEMLYIAMRVDNPEEWEIQ